MKFKLELNNIEWWLWTITTIFIISAISGWTAGYYTVMGISLFQIFYLTIRTKSLISFDTQVRIAYFALTLFGLWEVVRFPFYILLLIATIMVVLTGRCSLALILRCMPWNKKTMACSLERK